jgi:Flp pilus assembly pilin Flp
MVLPSVVLRLSGCRGVFFSVFSFQETKVMLRKLFADRRGQGLVEYGLIIAGVALISAAAISILGHKTSDLIGAVATILPGAHADDNGAIVSGKLIETSLDATTDAMELDLQGIFANADSPRLGNNVTNIAGNAADFGGLIVEPN